MTGRRIALGFGVAHLAVFAWVCWRLDQSGRAIAGIAEIVMRGR